MFNSKLLGAHLKDSLVEPRKGFNGKNYAVDEELANYMRMQLDV